MDWRKVKRKQRPKEFKRKVVMESYANGVVTTGEKYAINSALIYKWRKNFRRGKADSVSPQELPATATLPTKTKSVSEVEQLRFQNSQLRAFLQIAKETLAYYERNGASELESIGWIFNQK